MRWIKRIEDDTKEIKKRIEELRNGIALLKDQIAQNEQKEKERRNAVESHGVRFLERQRLVRMERTARKTIEGSQLENELVRIALDQVYVAHFPHDVSKYQPIFRKGVRGGRKGTCCQEEGSRQKQHIGGLIRWNYTEKRRLDWC